jgi:serine/threonine protein kinase
MIEELTERQQPPTELRSIGCYRLSKAHFSVESKLSECEFGMVLLAEHQLTKQSVAVRVVVKERLQKEGKVKRLAKQIALHRKLHHFTIVRLFELIETVDSIYLVFEWVDGTRLS